MKEYKFSEKNAKLSIKSQTAYQKPLIIITPIVAVIIINYQNGGALFKNPLILILAILFSGLIIGLALFIRNKRWLNILMKNVYRISDTKIERVNPTGEIEEIELNEIESKESSKKGLLLKTKNQKILIPKELDNFDEVSKLILDKIK